MNLPAMFPCGCSNLKVGIGMCDHYGPDGKPREAAIVGVDPAKPGSEETVFQVGSRPDGTPVVLRVAKSGMTAAEMAAAIMEQNPGVIAEARQDGTIAVNVAGKLPEQAPAKLSRKGRVQARKAARRAQKEAARQARVVAEEDPRARRMQKEERAQQIMKGILVEQDRVSKLSLRKDREGDADGSILKGIQRASIRVYELIMEAERGGIVLPLPPAIIDALRDLKNDAPAPEPQPVNPAFRVDP